MHCETRKSFQRKALPLSLFLCVCVWVLTSLKSSTCHHPTRAGLRSLASSWEEMDPAISYLWRRAAAPIWLGCRLGTKSWRSKVTMCQPWVHKPWSPLLRLRRTSPPVLEWCPAFSRSERLTQYKASISASHFNFAVEMMLSILYVQDVVTD